MATELNQTEMPYNITDISSFQGLFVQFNQYIGGGLSFGILLVVWVISLYSFA